MLIRHCFLQKDLAIYKNKMKFYSTFRAGFWNQFIFSITFSLKCFFIASVNTKIERRIFKIWKKFFFLLKVKQTNKSNKKKSYVPKRKTEKKQWTVSIGTRRKDEKLFLFTSFFSWAKNKFYLFHGLWRKVRWI